MRSGLLDTSSITRFWFSRKFADQMFCSANMCEMSSLSALYSIDLCISIGISLLYNLVLFQCSSNDLSFVCKPTLRCSISCSWILAYLPWASVTLLFQICFYVQGFLGLLSHQRATLFKSYMSLRILIASPEYWWQQCEKEHLSRHVENTMCQYYYTIRLFKFGLSGNIINS